MGLLEASDWQGGWIGAADRTISAPLLRRDFTLDRPIRRAMVHMSGLGFGELYVNGAKVGQSVLDPGNTYYNNDQSFALGARVLYVSHDVTDLLQPGANVFGVMLGHGWNSAEDDIPPAPSHRTPYGDRPKLLLQGIVEFADGEQANIVSDGGWKAAPGPITYNDFSNGERYDARRERPGWDCPDYDDADWQPAVAVDAPGGTLVAQTYAAGARYRDAAGGRADQPERGRVYLRPGADDHGLVPATAAGAGRRDGHAAARDLFIWGRDVGRAQ